jgi:hypothetical protein
LALPAPKHARTRSPWQQYRLQELAKEEPDPHTQPASSPEHDEELLNKLCITITESITNCKQEQQRK